MCVIFVVEDKRPTAGMVEAAFRVNPEGAGIAWRESGEVHWAKGLDLEEITSLVEEVPVPFVAHFRIASIGGSSRTLNHPFPIVKDVPLIMRGSSPGSVLFHNGHWHKWRDTMLDLSVKGCWSIPTDRWSDSRAMAFIAAHLNLGFLELIDEKIVAFGPEDLQFFGTGWSCYNEDYPFICSNRHWDAGVSSADGWRPTRVGRRTGGTSSCSIEAVSPYVTPPASMLPAHRHPNRQASGGPADQETFCGGYVRPEDVGRNPSTAAKSSNRQGPLSEAEKAIRAAGERSQAARRSAGASGGVQRETNDHPPLIHAPTKEDLEKVKWVRSLNPSKWRSRGGSTADPDIAKRREDAEKGITRIGPLS